MKALLLAGGLGTRLRPLTYTRPKHLLPVAGRPHILRVFDLLLRHGVTEVYMLVSYLAPAFSPVIEEARSMGLETHVVSEPEPMGTAGALRGAREFLGRESVLALNADVLTDADLSALIAFHEARGAEASILLTRVEDPSQFGVVSTTPDGRVTGFIEKPPPGQAPSNEINAGVYVLNTSVLDLIPRGRVWSAERQLFPALIDKGIPLYATGLPGYWIDVGTPEKYLQANLDLLALGRGPSGNRKAEVASGAVVEEGACLHLASVGRGSYISKGARVEESVLLEEVSVGEGARVVRSILGKGCKVPPGSRLEGQVLGDGERVGIEEAGS